MEIYFGEEGRRKIYSSILNHDNTKQNICECVKHTYDTENEAGFYTYFFPSRKMKRGLLFFPPITKSEKDDELDIDRQIPKWATKKNSYICPINPHTHPYLDAPPDDLRWGPSPWDLEGTAKEIKRLYKVREIGMKGKFNLIPKKDLAGLGNLTEFRGELDIDALPLPVDPIVTCTRDRVNVLFYQIGRATQIPDPLPEEEKRDELTLRLLESGDLLCKNLSFPDEWTKTNLDEMAEFFAQRGL